MRDQHSQNSRQDNEDDPRPDRRCATRARVHAHADDRKADSPGHCGGANPASDCQARKRLTGQPPLQVAGQRPANEAAHEPAEEPGRRPVRRAGDDHSQETGEAAAQRSGQNPPAGTGQPAADHRPLHEAHDGPNDGPPRSGSKGHARIQPNPATEGRIHTHETGDRKGQYKAQGKADRGDQRPPEPEAPAGLPVGQRMLSVSPHPRLRSS